jgi:hypothetical protein
MRTSDSIAKIAAALAKALPAVQNATKDATNPHFRSDYATLQAVIGTTKPVLAEHGIVALQGPGWDGDKCTLTTRFLHESGEWIETTAGTPVSKMDPQGVGSAITYLRRYSLAAMAGIGQDDDDGNAASETRDATGKPHRKPQAAPSTNGDACPKCSGALYDNRTKKAAGEFSPKSPDYACKDKDGCGWAFWLDSARDKLKAAVENLEVHGTVPVGSTKRIMDGVSDGDLDSLHRAQEWVNSKAAGT